MYVKVRTKILSRKLLVFREEVFHSWFLTAKKEFIQNRRKNWEKVFEITVNDSEFCLSLHWNFKRFIQIRLKIISNSFWKMFNQPLTIFYACNHNKMIVESKRIKNFHCKWHENNNQNCQLMFFSSKIYESYFVRTDAYRW
jgi:hypothetical protein